MALRPIPNELIDNQKSESERKVVSSRTPSPLNVNIVVKDEDQYYCPKHRKQREANKPVYASKGYVKRLEGQVSQLKTQVSILTKELADVKEIAEAEQDSYLDGDLLIENLKKVFVTK